MDILIQKMLKLEFNVIYIYFIYLILILAFIKLFKGSIYFFK